MTATSVFSLESIGRTLIVTPSGPVSSLAHATLHGEVQGLLAEMQNQGLTNVIVDFRHASRFGSLMLSIMLALSKRVGQVSGKMVLCNLPEFGREVLEVAQLDRHWPICPSRAAAVDALTA